MNSNSMVARLARMCAKEASILRADGFKEEAHNLAVRALALFWLAEEEPALQPVRVRARRS